VAIVYLEIKRTEQSV